MKTLLVLFGVFAVAFATFPNENIGIDDPYLVDGDIIVTPQQRAAWFGGRAAIKFKQWPGAVVTYAFHQSISENFMKTIKSAMKEFEQRTCLRFQPRTTERAYVEFNSDRKGCSSNVGMVGRKQTISLGPGCGGYGTVLHEIGHAIGYFHEHNRPDRDQYITVLWDNIIPEFKFAFNKKQWSGVDAQGTPYDYNSVMHYPAHGFSKNGKPTIKVKQSANIGQRQLSIIDAYEINRFYKCPGVTEMPFPTNGPPKSDFTCTFDDGPCGFIQLPRPDDDFDWERLSGNTPSSETGPVGDHTSGLGSYMYIEVSDRRKGKIAKMTKTIVLTGKSCLTFYYNMFGVYMGSVKVIVQGRTVFEKTGNQGKGWKKAEVQLQGTGQTKLEFHGTAGGNFRGDAAIDDLSMKDCQSGHVTTQPVTQPATTKPSTTITPAQALKCDFDTDLCGFTQESNDDFDWTRFDKKTPTWDSGPDADHTSGQGFYLYTEATNRKQGNVAVLSKKIQLSGNSCLRFYYHMHGTDMGSIKVFVDGRQVFQKTGPQGKGWKEASIKLNGTGTVKLAIHGVVGKSYRSDAGIDDLSIEECN